MPLRITFGNMNTVCNCMNIARRARLCHPGHPREAAAVANRRA